MRWLKSTERHIFREIEHIYNDLYNLEEILLCLLLNTASKRDL